MSWPYWSNGKRRVWFDDPDPGTLPPVPELGYVLDLSADPGPVICLSCGRCIGWSCDDTAIVCVGCWREVPPDEVPTFERPPKTYVRTAAQRALWARLWTAHGKRGRAYLFGAPWG